MGSGGRSTCRTKAKTHIRCKKTRAESRQASLTGVFHGDVYSFELGSKSDKKPLKNSMQRHHVIKSRFEKSSPERR